MKVKRVKQKEDLSQIRTILQSMTIGERFQWGSEDSLQDYEYDLKIIKKDVSFYLKDDLYYINRIRQNCTSSAPDTEEQKMLEAELSRMKKMYNYKINYLTIRSYLLKIEEMQKIELAKIEKIYALKINLLKYETAKPLHFRESTTAGYIMKMTRWAQRAHDQKIMERKRALEQEKEEEKVRIKKRKKT